ncbi:hypothetical protein [Shigella flexneri]|uniref:hypothetical protein n=1 Tax=Shigella flexneri TaxID=623 RepID=UPI001598B952|nr:hypothetical protein [Shigella flexneri]QKW68372.1 hypothetical protein FOB97_00020 [Shigella flexneri]
MAAVWWMVRGEEGASAVNSQSWKLVFHRKLIGVYLGHLRCFCTVFFLNLVPELFNPGITALKAGFMTTVPFLGVCRRPALWLGRGSAGT